MGVCIWCTTWDNRLRSYVPFTGMHRGIKGFGVFNSKGSVV